MKVFIERFEDGLFFKAEGVWVSEKEAAKDFVTCTSAIDCCMKHRIRHVRRLLTFGDPKYDLRMESFRVETRELVKQNRELRAQMNALLQQVDVTQAEMKERKKQIPFKRARESRR